MQENELWAIHDLLIKVVEYEDVDLEGTDYEEPGVGPQSIHKNLSEHKEAVYLLSGILEDEGIATELETWDEDYDDYSKWAGRYGRRDNPVGK